VERRVQAEIDRQRRHALGRYRERVLDAQALARFCESLNSRWVPFERTA
jgi:hypothetical protein